MLNKDVLIVFGKESNNETNQTFYIPKTAIAYILKRPDGGKNTDSYEIVLLNGKIFIEATGYSEIKKWLGL